MKKNREWNSLIWLQKKLFRIMKLSGFLIFTLLISINASGYSKSIKNAKDGAIIEQGVEQQQKSVSGKVTDSAGIPLPGVTVLVKSTTIGTITDNKGTFSLLIPADGKILVFSFVGMKSQEFAVGTKTTFNVEMAEDAIGIEEVVAVGYGTQKKASLTSAVNSVKADEMQNISVANASSAMVGKMPGIFTVQTSGEVGKDETKIKIRGVSTTGNSNPLIIIDGIPRNSLNELDMSTVESYTILKDAAAVAPYGMGVPMA